MSEYILIIMWFVVATPSGIGVSADAEVKEIHFVSERACQAAADAVEKQSSMPGAIWAHCVKNP